VISTFRKAHPSLCRSRFWREEVRWYGAGEEVDYGEDSHSIAFCLHGSSKNDDDLYVMINAYTEDLRFAIQEGEPGQWQRVVDTSLSSPMDFSEDGGEPVLRSLAYTVKPRSIVVLIRKE
jgi:isoamylase